ncbi:MAG: hypothetical protein FJ303_07480 [Planctomycetes bacterium]|nr:hypothetical protein [Planctomycetota bacterium]
MGIHVWRSLSILLLVSAALVGCNNTEKDKKVIGSNHPVPPNGNAWGNGVPQGPGFPNSNSQQFPKAADHRLNPNAFPIGGANASPINQQNQNWPGPSLQQQGPNGFVTQPNFNNTPQTGFVPNASPSAFPNGSLPAPPQPGSGFAGSRDLGPQFPNGTAPIPIPPSPGFPRQ